MSNEECIIKKEILNIISHAMSVMIDLYYSKIGSERFVGNYKDHKNKLLSIISTEEDFCKQLRDFNHSNYPDCIDNVKYDNLLEFLIYKINETTN